jgi:hypothetical protein
MLPSAVSADEVFRAFESAAPAAAADFLARKKWSVAAAAAARVARAERDDVIRAAVVGELVHWWHARARLVHPVGTSHGLLLGWAVMDELPPSLAAAPPAWWGDGVGGCGFPPTPPAGTRFQVSMQPTHASPLLEFSSFGDVGELGDCSGVWVFRLDILGEQ